MPLVGVIGAGAWGTALAQTVRQAGADVLLWARETETVAAINKRHENPFFLPGVALDPAIRAVSDLSQIAGCDLVLMVAPAQFVRKVSQQLAADLPPGTPLVICAKGIEQTTGLLLTDVVNETLPRARLAVLSGPCFAADVVRNKPTAVTLAAADMALAEQIAGVIGHQYFRPYLSTDMIGAEIGGSVKNVLAIAAGIVDGCELGASARAALITRGFAELVRFGRALGAEADTLTGMSGLGDLILTCSSPQSRNMSLGQQLGQGKTLEEVLAARNSVSEGVYTASALMMMARARQVEMPICQAVDEILSGRVSIEAAIVKLLARPFRVEH